MGNNDIQYKKGVPVIKTWMSSVTIEQISFYKCKYIEINTIDDHKRTRQYMIKH